MASYFLPRFFFPQSETGFLMAGRLSYHQPKSVKAVKNPHCPWLLWVHPHCGGWATAALRWMMQTKGTMAGQRNRSGCFKSQTYQGAVTKFE